MGLIEYILIIIGAIAAAFALITLVRRISAYYRQRYNISVWSGVFLLVISVVLVGLAITHYETPNILMVIIAAFFLLLTGFLDMRHAGVGMGMLALLFQTVMAVAFILVIIVAIVYFVIRSIRRGNDVVLDALTGTTSGFRNGVQLFFRFFMP